jgi:hypothetical protein
MSATRKRVRSNDAVKDNDSYFDLLKLGLSVTTQTNIILIVKAYNSICYCSFMNMCRTKNDF